MGWRVVNGNDATAAASPGCRRNVATPPAETFCRARVARLARRNPMKSIAAISSDGSAERVVSNSNAIQQSRRPCSKTTGKTSTSAALVRKIRARPWGRGAFGCRDGHFKNRGCHYRRADAEGFVS